VLLAARGALRCWCRPRSQWLRSPVALLAISVLVWISDTAAYFVGRRFGRHKLAPSVSPGKTIEGAAGALLASLAYAVILALTMPAIGGHVKGLAWAAYAAAAMLLCVLGILGDLFESGAKRYAGVKDSGKLLPGHGGVLDRVDAVCAALPVGALFAWAEFDEELTLLGATGSIGASTLDVVSRHPDRYRVFALSARNSVEPLLELCRKYRPRVAVLSGVAEDRSLRRALRIWRVASCASARLRWRRWPRTRIATA
jgi:hypothetical protein